MSTSPPIDNRKFEALVKEIIHRVPFYTPEWKVTDDRGLDSAMLKIFAQMLADTIQRLNQVPHKNSIAFLDSLGVNLLPALPARVPLTFYLSNGTTTSIEIPSKTQVAAPPADGSEPVSFETEKAILATPAKLVDAYSVNPQQDEIFRVPFSFLGEEATASFASKLSSSVKSTEKKLFLSTKAELEIGDLLEISGLSEHEYVEVTKVTENKVDLTEGLQKKHEGGARVEKVTNFELFQGKNKQEHLIYLGHQNLFKIKDKAVIKIFISPLLSNGLLNLINWQYYGKRQDSEEQDWYTFKREIETDTLILQKDNLDEFKELEINGIETLWIRGKVAKENIEQVKTIEIDTIEAIVESFKAPSSADDTTANNTMNTSVDSAIQPDLLFYNDIPLDKTNFYPFGQQPRLFDTFYFASQAAFSQKNSKITINLSIIIELPIVKSAIITEEILKKLKANGVTNITELIKKTIDELANILEISDENKIEKILNDARQSTVLSWEYWNSNGWLKLPMEPDNLLYSEEEKNIDFNCPPDLAQIVVNGQSNYWIRVRLVNGDYGREVFSVDNANKIIRNSVFYPPIIQKFNISYQPTAKDDVDVSLEEPKGFPLENCLTFNNLTFEDRTEECKIKGKLFNPFQSSEELNQSLYLGFDTPPIKGPISLFADLEIQEYTEKNRPRVEWQYFRLRNGEGEWAQLSVIDETNNLTQSGLIQWIGKEDFALKTYFNQTLYWIRAVDVERQFQPLARSKALKLFPAELRKLPPPAPRFQGLYLNTTWATQAESFTEQILGSSDATANQRFSFLKFPVITEEIWVNEITSLSTGERADLLAQKGTRSIEEEKDENLNTIAFWVRWEAVEDLLDSKPNDRHYQIDRTFGGLEFSDGIEGAIPPIGIDNIRANYQAGGGSRGNVEVGTVNILKSAIAFVDRTTNWQGAGGGSDTELIERALVRGSQQIRHQNRAVTVEDFEQLALQASRSIARVKCLPNFNDEGQKATGWVTVVIVPQSHDPQPQLSPMLRQQVENYLRERSSNIIVAPKHLIVTRPLYVEVNVTTTLVAESFDQVPQVEKAALEKINAFLHPLTGSDNNQGWQFGSLPCMSDFYEILENIKGVDHVDSLEITPDPNKRGTLIESYALVASGQHQISVQVMEVL
jgi:uncharacterized phage protein gp47/JayE